MAQFEFVRVPIWHIMEAMPKHSGEKRDFMQVAREIVERAIGERMDGSPLEKPADTRNPHAVALGKAGGKKGGEARAKSPQPSETESHCQESSRLLGGNNTPNSI